MLFADLHTNQGVDLRFDVAVIAIRPEPADPATAGAVLLADGTELAANNNFAPGDVAKAHHPLLGRQLRVEHWANGLHQPVVAAKTMLGQSAT